MPINSPDIFCFRINMNVTTTTVTSTPFTDIGAINLVPGTPCTPGASPGPTPVTPLLDDYPNAAGAYSVRLLSSSYAGSCIEAYRVSDATTQDIGFDSDGLLDTAEIISFASGSEVRVQTWYDQSSNGLDAFQSTSGNMPVIYDGSAIVEENGKPAMSGGILQLPSGITFTSTGFQWINVFRQDTTQGVWFGNNASNKFEINAGKTGTVDYEGTFTGSQSIVESGYAARDKQIMLNVGDDSTETELSVNGFLRKATGYPAANLPQNISRLMNSPFGGVLTAQFKIQESIIYTQDKFADRIGIESNINSYFDIYTEANATSATSGFLFDYSGSDFAYSVRELNNNATLAMRVRRSVAPFDEEDIGFDSNGDLDTAAIIAFGGSDAVTVSLWYDQSSNQRHAFNYTATQQMQIYDGASILTNNGRPCLAGGQYLVGSAIETAQPITYTMVKQKDNVDAALGVLIQVLTPIFRIAHRFDGYLWGAPNFAQNLGNLNNGQQNLTAVYNGASSTLHSNSGAITMPNPGTGSRGQINTLGAAVYRVLWQEMISWDSDKSSDRTAFEADINSYYSIY